MRETPKLIAMFYVGRNPATIYRTSTLTFCLLKAWLFNFQPTSAGAITPLYAGASTEGANMNGKVCTFDGYDALVESSVDI
jgi:hypothetical protein